MSPCPHLGCLLALRSVPMPIYGRLFGSRAAKDAWWASVHRVRSYLNGVVAEISWAERLSFVPRDICGCSYLGSRRAQKIQGTLFHGVLWGGKVVHHYVQLGELEWPYFEGIWKVCVCAALWGGIHSKSSTECAHSARLKAWAHGNPPTRLPCLQVPPCTHTNTQHELGMSRA